MSDQDYRRLLSEIDQKHSSYTRKFAQLKAHREALEGRVAALEALVEKLTATPPTRRKR